MKKFLFGLVFGLGVIFSMSSCVTPAYSQDVVITESDGNVDISYVIRYGTPYYFEGSLLYYLYDGWYYYPYYLNNRWYYYRYDRPFATYRGYRFRPQPGHRPHFESGRPPRNHGGRVAPPARGGRGFGDGRVAPDRPRSSTHMTNPPTRQTPNTPRVTTPNRSHSTPQATPRTTTPNRSFGNGGSTMPSRPSTGGRSAAPSRSSGGNGGGSRGFGGRR